MPSTDWKETIEPGEEARLSQYAEQLRGLQRRHAAKHGGVARALHAKPNAGLEAELEVLGELPEHARVGLFARPGKFRAWVRFSNGASVRQSDRKPDVRGMAIKVVGVEGKKIIPGMQDARTQDFLAIRDACTPVRNVDEFVALLMAAEQPALFPFRFAKAVGVARALQILRKAVPGFMAPMHSLASTRYYSAAPIQYGRYAVHFALFPVLAPDPSAKPKHFGDELAARLREGPVSYDFRVQFYCDEVKTPIEDSSVEWREADAPFLTVARLTLLQQDMASARGQQVAEQVEKFSFDPWHALEELRPLGQLMRARNQAYRLSTQERHAAGEPDGSERLE